MTKEQKKMLTEKLLKECWHEWVRLGYPDLPIGGPVFDHRCRKCRKLATCHSVYGSGRHRTFDTWPDLGVCMKMLVKEGKWFGFWTFTHRIFHTERQKESSRLIQDWDFDAWLFRPVNEAGKAHFCVLVAEFLEARLEVKDGQK